MNRANEKNTMYWCLLTMLRYRPSLAIEIDVLFNMDISTKSRVEKIIYQCIQYSITNLLMLNHLTMTVNERRTFKNLKWQPN